MKSFIHEQAGQQATDAQGFPGQKPPGPPPRTGCRFDEIRHPEQHKKPGSHGGQDPHSPSGAQAGNHHRCRDDDPEHALNLIAQCFHG